MSFKSKNPPAAPSLPQQQAAPELMDIIDELSGFQTITVTGPDGKKRRITQRLPLTAKEQQTLDQAENLINTAVNNIEALYKYDPSTVVDYQPFIKAFADINKERINDLSQIGNFKDIAERVEKFRAISRDLTMQEFDTKQRMSEESLARRGLSKSTQASEERALMTRERALLAQQVDVNSQDYQEDLQNRQIARESGIYGLREQGRQGRLQEAETEYNLERQKAADIEGARQSAINENVNMLGVGQGIKGGDTQKAQLALGANQNAISMFNSQANNSNQRHANEISRIQGQYKMDMDKFRNTPATFGQKLGDIGLSLAGQAVGGAIGGAIPGGAAGASSMLATGFGNNASTNKTSKKGV